ncbi:unnamed protein product [Debaryomyces fabryi]|nr:unnamed protein product [Debaryomyces fabryi]
MKAKLEDLLYMAVDDHENQGFSVFADVVIGVYDSCKVTFEDNYLKINHNTVGYIACKNIPYDPNYIWKYYFVLMRKFFT